MLGKYTLKVFLVVSALVGALTAQTAVAKEPRTYHTATTAKHAKAEAKTGKASTGEGEKDENPISTQSGDKLDAGVTVLTPRASNLADKTRSPPANVKFAKPVNVQTLGVGVPELVKPVTRNAIGEAVGQHINTPAAIGHSDVASHIAAVPTANLPVARQPLHPIASATNPDRGKVDDSHVIRPTVTSELGGPAKSTTGINGTTMRPKY